MGRSRRAGPGLWAAWTISFAVCPLSGEAGDVFRQDSTEQGFVVLEAESHSTRVASSTPGARQWQPRGDSRYSGGQSLVVLPTGERWTTSYDPAAPRLVFHVEAIRTDVLHVWVRGRGASTDANSLYVALDDGEEVASGAVSIPVHAEPRWSRGPAPTIPVSAGPHVLAIQAREAGTFVDKIVLTRDPSWTPEGMGPAESERIPEGDAEPTPVAVDDAYTIHQDSTRHAMAVLSNDLDSSGGSNLVVTRVSRFSAGGSATIVGERRLQYTPAQGFSGEEIFTYDVLEPGKRPASATVTVTILPSDGGTPPQAVDDRYTVNHGSLGVPLPVLSNDTDSEGGSHLVVTGVSSFSAGGAVAIGNETRLHYTPRDGFSGEETFTYEILEPGGLPASATVTVTVLPAGESGPVVVQGSSPQYFLILEAERRHKALTATTKGPRSWQQVEGSEFSGGGAVIVRPAGASWRTNLDSTAPRLEFNVEAVTTGVLHVWVRGRGVSTSSNSLHVALQGYPLDGGTGIASDAVHLPVDVEPRWNRSPAPTIRITQGPHVLIAQAREAGTIVDKIVLSADPTWRPSGMGPMSEPPVATDDAYTVDEGAVAATLDVLANDTDSGGGSRLAIIGVSGFSAGGFATVVGRTQLRYTPAAGFRGEESFTYDIVEPGGLGASATVRVTVVPSVPPMVVDDTYTVNQDAVARPLDVLSNDTDSRGGSNLIITSLSEFSARGSGTIVEQESLHYTPARGFSGEETFRYDVLEPGGLQASATVTVTVVPTDGGPVVDIDDVTVFEADTEDVTANFTVTLSRASNFPVSVRYATVPETATAGGDYLSRSGLLNFEPGALKKTISIAVLGETLAESTETFRVVLSDPTWSRIGDGEARCTIIDGDTRLPGLDERPSNPDCLLPSRPELSSIRLQNAFPNIFIGKEITMLAQLLGDNSRICWAERRGRLRWVDNRRSATTTTVALNLSSRVAAAPCEGGIQGMTFHYDFTNNPYLYILYGAEGNPCIVRLSRFESFDGGDTFDPSSEIILMSRDMVDAPGSQANGTIHMGGTPTFGPDNLLYFTLGDLDDPPTAQNLAHPGGSVLRIDVDNGSPYAIPPDNPFADGGGSAEIFAWGFRQPWRFSIDRATGELWLGDVGDHEWEEVIRVRKGSNHGWPIVEGEECYQGDNCDTTGFDSAYHAYSHNGGPSAVIGGFVYRGSAMAGLYGTYIYGDYRLKKIFGLNTTTPISQELVDTPGEIYAFHEDIDGELYVLVWTPTDKTRIYKLLEQTGGSPSTFPQQLSDVPCVDPADPSRPLDTMIPYDINVSFWSDNAVKNRWFAIPDGTTIHIAPVGNWEFPIGSLFLKNFRLNDTLVETRLLIRHEDGGWGGYSYEWNAAQTDATLLTTAKTKAIEGQDWTYPSREQCSGCHTSFGGEALGFQTPQMNRLFTYPSTGRTSNQLSTFESIGLLDAPLSDVPANLPAFPALTDTSRPLEERARAYLHANCSYCHRPENPFGITIDFRWDTTFADMQICDMSPVAGDLGIAGARRLSPGSVEESIISVRVNSVGAERMPPIGKNVVDPVGSVLLEEWILSLTACP